jgi:hypothetical protein
MPAMPSKASAAGKLWESQPTHRTVNMWWKTVASSCLYIYKNFNIKFWHIPTFFLVAHQTNQKIWSQATPLRLARAQSGGSRCHVSSIWLAAAEWQPHLSNTFFQNGHTIDRCIVCISSQKIMQNRSRSHSHSLSLSLSLHVLNFAIWPIVTYTIWPYLTTFHLFSSCSSCSSFSWLIMGASELPCPIDQGTFAAWRLSLPAAAPGNRGPHLGLHDDHSPGGWLHQLVSVAPTWIQACGMLIFLHQKR